MMEFVGFDDTIPDERVHQLYDGASSYLRSELGAMIGKPWFGWRPMTWDSLPIIGALPKLNNVFVATGHQMIGLMSAPATGKLIAELISGTQPHIRPEPYSAARFAA